jgi:uncharacterized protein (DUF1697 family)
VTYVVLLRAINVGGRGRLAMADLVAVARELGAADPRTYIQSGNLVCGLPAEAAAGFGDALTAELLARFAVNSPVVMRTAAEWSAVLPACPYPDDGSLHVGFLQRHPEPERVARLDPQRSPGDRFTVHGRELYLSFANGVGRSKLTNDWFDRQLGVASTWRNTRTLRAIEALLA